MPAPWKTVAPVTFPQAREGNYCFEYIDLDDLLGSFPSLTELRLHNFPLILRLPALEAPTILNKPECGIYRRNLSFFLPNLRRLYIVGPLDARSLKIPPKLETWSRASFHPLLPGRGPSSSARHLPSIGSSRRKGSEGGSVFDLCKRVTMWTIYIDLLAMSLITAEITSTKFRT